MLEDVLKNIRVVLLEPQYSGNLGSVARAMENFALEDLVLVNPTARIDRHANKMASHAKKTLQTLRIVETLEEALAETKWAVAFTGVSIKRSEDQIDFEALIPLVMEAATSSHIALVFGREDWGLDHQAMDRCRYITMIPTHPQYEALNLSQAVLLVAHHLYAFGLKNIASPVALKKTNEEANFSEREAMFEDLRETLLHIDFINHENMASMMRRIRRFIERTTMTSKEVKVLRGICRQLRWADKNLPLPQNELSKALERSQSPGKN